MANRNWANSRIYTGHVQPVMLDVSIPIGASGAVGTITGPYISSVTKLATGLYQIKMQDNYSGYYCGSAQIISPTSGSDLLISSVAANLTVGQPYRITILGTASAAQWAAVGVPAGVTPAVGVSFVALATGDGGVVTSRVKLVAPGSNIAKIELIGNPNSTIAPVVPTVGATGALVTFQTLALVATPAAYTPAGTNSAPAFTGTLAALSGDAQSYTPAGTVAAPVFTGTAASLTTTMSYALAHPTDGSTLKISLLLSNSSVLIGGE